MDLARSARRGASGARTVVRRMRGAARAEGAGESGLAHLIEVHAVSTAGDALVAVGLAGTLFFNVPVGQARGKVALYLLLTMAPFALLAPVIGPLLDRVRRGRRIAIFSTLLLRGLLAVALAAAITGSDPLTLYPTAFGLLIAAKAYTVARSAVVPRLRPSGLGLVRANSRLTMAGLLFGTVAAGLGGAVGSLFGPAWTLRLAAATFFVGAALTFGLPTQVDSTEAGPDPVSRRRRLFLDPAELGARVRVALVAAGSIRALNGFLTIFLAFLLREQGRLDGLSSTAVLGLVLGAAALGGLLGTSLGGRAHGRAPLALAVLAVTGSVLVALAGALVYGLVTLLVVGLATGVGQAVSKLALDSLVQQDVRDGVRSSAFSLSESTLQLSWVLGGAVGVVLPPSNRLGFSIATAATAGALGWCLVAARRARSLRVAGRPVPRAS